MAIRVRPGIETIREKSGTLIVRFVEWISIRGTHQGQRSSIRTNRPDTRLLLIETPDFKKSPCNAGTIHTGPSGYGT